MKKAIKNLWLCLALLLLSVGVNAQQTAKPKFIIPQYADYSIAQNISDNGKWVIVAPIQLEYQAKGNVRLTPVDNGKSIIVKDKNETDEQAAGKYAANDVTDDGNIVVGGVGGYTAEIFKGKPAYWNRQTQTWTQLPLPEGYVYGEVFCVTPDGKYAVGRALDSNESSFDCKRYGVMWDLTTNTIVDLPNRPVIPCEGAYMETISNMSADGRYLIFYGNQMYAPLAYLYDRKTQKSVKLGYEGTNLPKDVVQLDAAVPGISFNGKYVVYRVNDKDDNIYFCVYNTETGANTVYNGNDDQQVIVDFIDNDGNIYGSTPFNTPVRDFYVRNNGLWYPFSMILKQAYGIDFEKYTSLSNTGTLNGLSADAKSFSLMVSPTGESYVVTMPDHISDACNSINLLEDYTTTPAADAEFSTIETVQLVFGYNITVKGGATSVLLKDESGKTVRKSLAVAVDKTNANTLVVTFRATNLEAGKKYTVEIPAGTVALAGNTEKTNKDITVNYRGRANKPVGITEVFPVDHSTLSRIDNSSNPVYLTFDTKVAATSTAKAYLYQIDGDSKKLISNMSVVTSGNQAALTPAATQYLYDGYEYQVVLAAGSITDVVGSKGSQNEEYVINYHGSYERQINTDDATLFKEDFNNISQALSNMMRYEGDHNTPTQEMQTLEFDADNQPWNFSIREGSGSSDYCAASTSMYNPAGQSDDWMVTPQINIPDKYCTLTFDAQSYLEDKKDVLKLVIWTADENIGTLTDDVIKRMKAEGSVKEYTLNIGDSEEGLAGEYEKITVDLAAYAGKNIYIGFWNNNNDQSMVFVDNIEVKRNLKYLMSLTSASSVVKKDEMNVAGKLLVNDDDRTYSSVKLTLKDADGKTVSTFAKDGLSLKKNDAVAFSFDKPLPLTVGKVNNYTIDLQLDDYTDVIKSSVKDLAFEPVKRVVLEENTGTTCPNCPLGILAIEQMEKAYGDQFIPVSIHAYQGDPYGTGVSSYAQALNLTAAPTGMVQRNGSITSPMTQNDEGDFTFTYNNSLWMDQVANELNVPADMDVTVPSVSYDESTNELSLPVTVKPALNLNNQFLNVFVVALEDSLVNSQENLFYATKDPLLGEWGKGGKYAAKEVDGIVHNDVVRTYYGSSVYGTSVGYPQSLEAGKEYVADITLSYPGQITVRDNGKLVVMLFDGQKNQLVNSTVVKLKDISTGINNTVSPDASGCSIKTGNGYVAVRGTGAITVSCYTLEGSLIARGSGNSNVAVALNGYQGAVIVKAVCGNSSVSKTVIVK